MKGADNMNSEAVTGVKKISSIRQKSKSKLKGRWESPIAGYLFILPWLLGFFILTLWPMTQSIYYSLTNFNLLDSPKWIGLRNYQRILLEDDVFRQSAKVTFSYVFMSVPLKLAFALGVAIIINNKIKGMNIYRTFIYFPSLIGGSVAVAILWRNMWGIDGFVNKAVSILGIKEISWISDPRTALGTLVVLSVWQFGLSMVIFLAGLKQISLDLYEAASIDGASRFRKFISITLPLLSPIIQFNLVYQTIGAFQNFTQAFIITQGGPIHSTFMYALYLYERAFSRFQMGYASAMAWLLLIIIAIITALIFASSRYWVFYETEGGKKK